MKLFSIPIAVGLLLALSIVSPTSAEPTGPSAAPVTAVDVHNLPALGSKTTFDPQKSTNAYLAQVSGAARARSDAYFEGGYVLLVVDAIYALAVSALLLWLNISARLRSLAERWSHSRFWQASLYAAGYLVVTAVATLPLSIYEGFIRERAYGLMNQSFLQ